ncbi:hypothetical protein I2I05_21600 [Hymenobacter sp. BT683]|uniref:Lipoprotein n=1 Tax=Hymenobacter jeongseonensis TaxID=2791027 RepID=A0ABS0INN4_9BACT|nr:hypothetical protein [Hymenobacter jeongseonensis]MBF9240000.1 hypothetical protein [Hymenobacter jeongseonensis]
MPSPAFHSMLVCFGTGFLLASCQGTSSEAEQPGQLAAPTSPVPPVAVNTPPTTPSSAPHQTARNDSEPRPTWYRFEDDTLRQTLRVVQVSARTIRFHLVDSLKTTGKARRLEGTATALAGDPEIDEDEDGNAYPSVAYNYEGTCVLAVRIELKTRQRVQLTANNCSPAHPDGTFEHGGILYRVPANN